MYGKLNHTRKTKACRLSPRDRELMARHLGAIRSTHARTACTPPQQGTQLLLSLSLLPSHWLQPAKSTDVYAHMLCCCCSRNACSLEAHEGDAGREEETANQPLFDSSSRRHEGDAPPLRSPVTPVACSALLPPSSNSRFTGQALASTGGVSSSMRSSLSTSCAFVSRSLLLLKFYEPTPGPPTN